MCVPCDPCMQYDPCGNTGVSSGYFGSYLPAASDCGCSGGGAATMVPSTVMPGTIQGGGIPTYPAPSGT